MMNSLKSKSEISLSTILVNGSQLKSYIEDEISLSSAKEKRKRKTLIFTKCDLLHIYIVQENRIH